ncbi:MAG: type II secretion system F family protein [Chlamydiales bacterium]|nr:type II secretion system F family protein [Chlamydiales bacterium]
MEKSIKAHVKEEGKGQKHSVVMSLMRDWFVDSTLLTTVSYLNLIVLYGVILLWTAGYTLSVWYIFIYLFAFYFLNNWREGQKEKDRLQIAHRIPFFADALANCLSVGMTLEQAFTQSSYYLTGKIKDEFTELTAKHALGKDLGTLLQNLDARFPNTGLRYLISLLEEYKTLGVGITPLLKKISVALADREEAEDKIRTILAAGSSYARLTIVVFAVIFVGLAYFLRDQVAMLLSPELRPTFFFLCAWVVIGTFMVTRVTSIGFAKSFSLRPYIKNFMSKDLSMSDLLVYSGMEWSPLANRLLTFAPLIFGFCCSYLVSLYRQDLFGIEVAFLIGTVSAWGMIRFALKGMVEDQLIKTIETFPEVLQIFTIGLNSGLNTYLAFELARSGVHGVAPRILTEELCRAKFAMECGEPPSQTWLRLSQKLPFETVIDFCEIMVVAPMHGESIIHSINQMTNTYQVKKLGMIEKKATNIGQMVIPLIVIIFFPFFLFTVFAPLVTKLGSQFS